MSNRQVIIWVMAFVLGGPVGFALGQENQIVNSEFDDGLTGWLRYGTTGFDVSVVQNAGLSGPNAALLDVTDVASTASIGLAHSGFVLEPGKTIPSASPQKHSKAGRWWFSSRRTSTMRIGPTRWSRR